MKIVMNARAALTAGLALILQLPAGAGAATTSYAGAEGALGFNNSSASGSAVEGTVSPSGNTSLRLPFGVLGEYEASTTVFGIGLAGISTTGYGVAAEALGNNPAMIGIASGSGGAMEVDSQGTGVEVQTNSGTGVVVTSGGTAAAVVTTATASSAVLAVAYGGGNGGQFQSLAKDGNTQTGGVATLGLSNGIGAAAFGNADHQGYPTLTATAYNSGDVFDGANDEAYTMFKIAGSTANMSGTAPANGSDAAIAGDVFLHGVYFACPGGQCHELLSKGVQQAEIATRNGAVESYAAAQSEPTVETTGESRLTSGASYVRLDTSYAKSISPGSSYLVFVTPEGETHGLYVASRTPYGFKVREHAAGRSSVAFTYRIVARAPGPRVARFARIQTVRSPLFAERPGAKLERPDYPRPQRIQPLDFH